MCTPSSAPAAAVSLATAVSSPGAAASPGGYIRPRLVPQAPQASASRTSSATASPGSCPGARNSAVWRALPWPTSGTRLTAARFAASTPRYSPNPAKPSGASGSWSMTEMAGRKPGSAGSRGAGLMPQLPATSVVIPCVTRLGQSGVDSQVRSEWAWMSMNPGQTSAPAQPSPRTPADPLPGRGMASTRPPRSRTSARRGGTVPLPSTTSPPVSRSAGIPVTCSRRAQAEERQAVPLDDPLDHVLVDGRERGAEVPGERPQSLLGRGGRPEREVRAEEQLAGDAPFDGVDQGQVAVERARPQAGDVGVDVLVAPEHLDG